MMASNLLLKHLPPHALSLPSFHHHPLSKRSNKKPLSFSLSPPPPPPPPTSREDAILQAKTSLSASLQRPLTNPLPLLSTRKLKKQKQPRFRVEIPVADDSPSSLSLLASDLFSDLPLVKKGNNKPTLLLLWPATNLFESAREAFSGSSASILISMLNSIEPILLDSADLAAFVAPESSQLGAMKTLAEELYPKPLVLLNPQWGFEEEKDFGGGFRSFVGSFDVVYSFMGLEVKGLLSRRKGVVLRCAKEGVVSGGAGEGWVVMMEEDGGEMRVVSRFNRRPEIGEVENVMYNLMAANSPVTKSVKFLRDLASNVTGKKVKQ